MKLKKSNVFKMGGLLFLLGIILWGYNPVFAFTAGKTYDKTNYQEIKELLIPPMLKWMEKGDFIIQTGKPEFEFKVSNSYLQASSKNEGNFDVNNEGTLVEKTTQKPVQYLFGYPFPKIDVKDAKAGEKVAENNAAIRFRAGGYQISGYITWIGRGGLERKINATNTYLYYQQRLRGPIIPNTQNFLVLKMQFVNEPIDLRGVGSLYYIYNDSRADSAWSYVPMLRRIRRTSAANRSDPFAGSDFCGDDAAVWDGKNGSMKWKFLGQKTYLVPFLTNKKGKLEELADGSFKRTYSSIRKGYEVPGWKGASWAPVDLVWMPRSLWIVEMVPKDPYYNYGRQILYMDRDTYATFFKEIYDRSGTYWKTVVGAQSYLVSPSGQESIGITDFYSVIDDKSNHAGSADLEPRNSEDGIYNLPLNKLSAGFFTEANLLQKSK